jgi:D-amino-acid dehydrogenase
MTKPSYLVIGAGLVGAASALRLRAAGFETTLIDPGDSERGASYGNAGHIAAEQCEPLASPHTLSTFPSLLFAFGGPLDFRWRDAPLWAPFAARFIGACRPETHSVGVRALTALMRDALDAWRRLAALAQAPSLLEESGHSVVWMNAGRAARGIEAWKRAEIGATSFRELAPDELARYGALMNKAPARGIRFSGTAKLADPQGVRDALLADFAARGGLIRQGRVKSLAADEAGVAADLASGERLRAGAALIAAGAWSGALMRMLGVRVPLIGERGYSIQSAQHDWPLDLPPAVFEERALVVTRFTSGLRATSFVEFGAPDAPGDPRKWRKLERDLRELGIAFAPNPSRWVGPRPTLPDYLPAIGRMRAHPNVLYAFGHQHLGITLSAVTAEIAERLALDIPPTIDLAPFGVERFSRGQ